MVSSVSLVGWRLKNIFRPARVFWYYTKSTNWFSYHYLMTWFYMMYTCIFLYIIVFSTFRCSKLGTFIFYSVYLTKYFVLTPFTSLFWLGVSLLRYRSCSSVLWWTYPILSHFVSGCILDYSLDMFWKFVTFVSYFIT